jgi:hypothetical protein
VIENGFLFSNPMEEKDKYGIKDKPATTRQTKKLRR